MKRLLFDRSERFIFCGGERARIEIVDGWWTCQLCGVQVWRAA